MLREAANKLANKISNTLGVTADRRETARHLQECLHLTRTEARGALDYAAHQNNAMAIHFQYIAACALLARLSTRRVLSLDDSSLIKQALDQFAALVPQVKVVEIDGGDGGCALEMK